MSAALPILRDDSFLDRIEIATPCEADWEAMKGDDRVRRCGDCRLDVYNISALSRAEAAALILEHEGGRVCVRLFRRPDGTLITRDCKDVMGRAHRRGAATFAAVVSMMLMSGFIAHKCGAEIAEPEHSAPIQHPVMGAAPPMMGHVSRVHEADPPKPHRPLMGKPTQGGKKSTLSR